MFIKTGSMSWTMATLGLLAASLVSPPPFCVVLSNIRMLVTAAGHFCCGSTNLLFITLIT